MLVRTLAPKGWIEGSHIDWRRERVSAMTLDSRRGWLVRSHVGLEENETFFIRVWKPPLSSTRVLKTLRGSLKGKIKKGQYPLVVGLSGYNFLLEVLNIPQKKSMEETNDDFHGHISY